MPPPPGRLSITNCWPRLVLRCCPTRRAMMSVTPAPAANGTTMRTGRFGYPCPSTPPANSNVNDSIAAPWNRLRKLDCCIGFSLPPSVERDVGRFNHLGPLLHFLGEHLLELGRRVSRRVDTQPAHAVL